MSEWTHRKGKSRRQRGQTLNVSLRRGRKGGGILGMEKLRALIQTQGIGSEKAKDKR